MTTRIVDKGRLYLRKHYIFGNICLFLVFFTIPFALYMGPMIRGELFVSGDGLSALNSYLSQNRAIWNGNFPLWDMLSANGRPLSLDLTSTLFYPFHLLLSFLTGSVFATVFYAVHLATGAIFMYHYLKKIGCNKKVSFVMALVYELSIHLGGVRKEHLILICTVIYVPMILFYVEQYIDKKKFRYLLYASIAMAMQFLGGFIQYVIYTDIVVGLYLLFSAVKKKRPILKTLRDIFLWVISYFSLIAFQLIPTLMILLEYLKVGASTTTSYYFFESYTIHFVKLLMMVFPKIFSNNYFYAFGIENSSGLDIEIYLGIFVLLVMVFCIKYYRKDFRVSRALCFAIGLFLFAASVHIPYLGEAIYYIPVLSGFRVISRVLFLFIFFCFTLCALGLSRMQQEEGFNKFARFTITRTIPVLLLILFIIFVARQNQESTSLFVRGMEDGVVERVIPSLALLLGIGACLLLFISVVKKKGYSQKVYVTYLLLFMAVTLSETFPYFLQSSYTKLSDVYERAEEETELMPDYRAYKSIYLGSGGGLEIPTVHFTAFKNRFSDTPLLNAYDTFNNPRLAKTLFGEVPIQINQSGGMLFLSGIGASNEALSMLGVKYLLNPSELILEGGVGVDGQENAYVPILLDKESNYFLYENVNACEALYVPERVISVEDENWIYGQKRLPLDRVSYVESYLERDLSGIKTDIEIVSHTNSQITARVDSSENTFLNFSQNYFPGWKARVNGEPTEIYLVNGLIQGIELPAGESEVRFYFSPDILYYCIFFSSVTLLIIILYAVRSIKREKDLQKRNGEER